jgi:N-acetylneuraminic acid mutarotase
VSGDDASQLAAAPPEHPGLPKSVLAYDTRSDRWSEAGTTPAPRVTVPAVEWNRAWVVPSGEQRPGIRSPEVWNLPPRKSGDKR